MSKEELNSGLSNIFTREKEIFILVVLAVFSLIHTLEMALKMFTLMLRIWWCVALVCLTLDGSRATLP